MNLHPHHHNTYWSLDASPIEAPNCSIWTLHLVVRSCARHGPRHRGPVLRACSCSTCGCRGGHSRQQVLRHRQRGRLRQHRVRRGQRQRRRRRVPRQRRVPVKLPPRRGDRPRRRRGGRRRRPPHGRVPPPPPLPRLLRQWLRRLRAPGRHALLRRREDGGAQRQLAEGLRGGRRHQGPARAGLPRDRLLRRRPRHRRARLRRCFWWTYLAGGSRPQGQPHGESPGRQQQPPRADFRRRHARAEVHRRRPLRQGHGRPLRRAHHRESAVHDVQRAHRRRRRRRLGRARQQGHGVPAVAAAAVRGVGGGVGAGAPGPVHAGHLRQPVLHQPAVGRRPAALRPGAGQLARWWRSRGRRGARCRLRVRRVALLRRLCGLHAEDGEAGAGRGPRRRRGPPELPRGQLACWLANKVD